MEAGETPKAGIGAELDRIESAADAGDTDLSRLGFWRIVGLIKRDDELIERYSDQAGRIDSKAFRARVGFRVPVWVGNSLLLGAVAFGALAVMFAVAAGTPTLASEPNPLLAGVALVVAAGAWAVGVHSPVHWLVGRMSGIRFTDYFLGGPRPPRPGLKTDLATYLRAAPGARAWMHASGAVATKLAPFLALGFAPAANAPGWAVAILVVLGIGQIVTDVVFSTKTSDWKKVRRELAVARSQGRRSSR